MSVRARDTITVTEKRSSGHGKNCSYISNRLGEAIFRFATSQVSSCELGDSVIHRLHFSMTAGKSEWGLEVRSCSE